MRDRRSPTFPGVPSWPEREREAVVDALAELFAWYARRTLSPVNDTTPEPQPTRRGAR